MLYERNNNSKKCTKPQKKFNAIFPDGKIISFGATGYEHYTEGHIEEIRRHNYETRHKAIGDFNHITKPSFWAFRFLWLKKTYREAIRDIESKYNVKINYVK